MKVCLTNELINKGVHILYGEEKAKEMGYIIVEVPEGYEDCTFEDFDNFVFSVDKYNTRKVKEKENSYEETIVRKIRKKYNINQELAILRQRDVKTQEFAEYNAYVEQCKLEAKQEVSNGN